MPAFQFDNTSVFSSGTAPGIGNMTTRFSENVIIDEQLRNVEVRFKENKERNEEQLR